MGVLREIFETKIGKSLLKLVLNIRHEKQVVEITIWDPENYQIYDACYSEDYIEELGYLDFFESCRGLFKYLKSQYLTLKFDFDKQQMRFCIIINAVLKKSKTLLFPIAPRTKNYAPIINEKTSIVEQKLLLSKPDSVSSNVSYSTLVERSGKVKVYLQIKNKQAQKYNSYILKIDQASFRRYCLRARNQSRQNIAFSVGSKEVLIGGTLIDTNRAECFTHLFGYSQVSNFGSVAKINSTLLNKSIIYIDVDTLNFKITLWVDNNSLISSTIPQKIRNQELYFSVLLRGYGTEAELFLDKP